MNSSNVPRVKVWPIAEGKNDNIHFRGVIGSKRNPLLKFGLVAFMSTGKAYISRLDSKSIEFKPTLIDGLSNSLSSYGFELVLFGNEWDGVRLSTEDILHKVSNLILVDECIRL